MSPPRTDLVPDAGVAADLACVEIDCMRWTSQSAVGACQSPGSKVQVTTLSCSSCAAASSHGLRQPKGGRKNLGGAFNAPAIAS